MATNGKEKEEKVMIESMSNVKNILFLKIFICNTTMYNKYIYRIKNSMAVGLNILS